jgi:DNA-binding transcriptional MerR regulator
LSSVTAPQNETPEIPDKLYFRIGEVAKLAGVKPYVLRYWESEFPVIEPKKSGTNHRLYRRKDVEMILEIKRLLYDKRYTIEGARKFLAAGKTRGAAKPKASAPPRQPALFDSSNELIEKVRRELNAILTLLR